MSEIVKIVGREILDSRGNPTVEAEVTLKDGTVAAASVPSGASVGRHEAVELRDKGDKRYHRLGVLSAVSSISEQIQPALIGVSAFDGDECDLIMIALDGEYNKSRLGANAILAVSLAVARAAAKSAGMPLYRYLGGALASKMPIPMMNIMNGGVHAQNNLDIQEFMIIPTGATGLCEGVRMCSEIYHTLKNILNAEGYMTAVGDEGGFAPNLPSDEAAIDFILRAIADSGYRAGADVSLGLDVAASGWYSGGEYVATKSKRKYTSDELCEYFLALVGKYPIISIEDPLGEDDFSGWQRLTERFSDSGIMLVGDDLFVTDAQRIATVGGKKIANSVLIKPNQVGTLSECSEAVFVARGMGYKTILSHRSADTEDSFIADLAVALGADFIKTGAPVRGERTAKYNRLMKIESELFDPVYLKER